MKAVVLVCMLFVLCVCAVRDRTQEESEREERPLKDYPAPLFIWAENDRYLRGGRQWVSESVTNEDVLEYISTLTNRQDRREGEERVLPTQSVPHHPEVVVLFLQPSLLFGQTEHYGGSRFSSSQLQLKKLKRMIEGAYSSVVAPYTYDISFSLSPQDHESHLMLTWSDMIGDYIDRCGQRCQLFVDIGDGEAERVWEPLLITNPHIIKVNGEKYFEENPEIFTNDHTDLLVIHLPTDLSLADLKVSKVMEVISRHTKSYVALFTADDMYVPTQSTQPLRETTEKWEWVERRANNTPSPSPSPPPPTPSPSFSPSPPPPSSGEFPYASRWPEFVWEFLLSFLLIVIIFCFGVCCLCGIDTPRRFDNPKEKNL